MAATISMSDQLLNERTRFPADGGAGWITWRRCIGGVVLAPACLRFDAAGFDTHHFALAGIDCPPPIARAVRKRQSEYFFGRLCARSALTALGLAHVHIGTGTGRAPSWPAGVVGSITHCNKIAAAIVAWDTQFRGIGIDIEEVNGEPAVIDALLATAVSAVEMDRLADGLALFGRCLPVVLVFSAKESFFKALYGTVRRYFDFAALELEELDIGNGTLVFRLCEHLDHEWTIGRRCLIHFDLLDAHHVATLFAW